MELNSSYEYKRCLFLTYTSLTLYILKHDIHSSLIIEEQLSLKTDIRVLVFGAKGEGDDWMEIDR